MRRLSPLAALLLAAVAAFALVLNLAPLRTGAQPGTPMAGKAFVGVWRLTAIEPGNPPLPALATFAADGTLLNSDPPVSPGSGGEPITFNSGGHGVWQQRGPTTAALTFVQLITDGQGHFLGTTTISAQVTLGADGNALHGPFSVTAADPGGKTIFQGTGTVQATRITVQPMTTPAMGTPAA